jgi:hypothetical protein
MLSLAGMRVKALFLVTENNIGKVSFISENTEFHKEWLEIYASLDIN